ncbi:MAG: Lrp/AsnC family transcriptional regulator, partial [Candidatus Nanohaloarchaea archaeon]|nr:Lrp/AsnC family transcriptional regulator [Candidatus Nanohaloarchaea archaeon]
MPQLKRKQEGIEYLLDDVTMKIVDTLLDNPAIPYNKSQLAEAADVSRDALYRRWDTLVERGIL